MHRNKRDVVLLGVFIGFIAVFAVSFWIAPKQSFSSDEKRALQAVPTLSFQTLTDGTFASGTEAYLADHFPARKVFVGLEAYFTLSCGNNGENGVYMGKNGWLINTPVSVNRENFIQNLQTIRNFAKKEALPASLMAVPSTGYIMKSELPTLHEPYPDAALLKQAQTSTKGAVQWIDLSGPFASHAKGGPLYYRTDHHWTTPGAYLAYQVFAKARGISAVPASDFQIEAHSGFYGTTYSKSGFWNTRPDTVEVWKDPALQVQVELRDDGRPGLVRSDSLFFPQQLKNEDHYPVFLNGNHSLVKIRNPKASGGNLLIIKDSYANCLAPFLAEHYRQIDMVDLRYFRTTSVSTIVKQDSIDEVLFVYGLDSLVNDSNLPLLS